MRDFVVGWVMRGKTLYKVLLYSTDVARTWHCSSPSMCLLKYSGLTRACCGRAGVERL